MATGADLDAWAEQFNVPPRSIVLDESETHVVDFITGVPLLTDDAFRKRILAKLRGLT
jgi:phage-related baseplate assembly protein